MPIYPYQEYGQNKVLRIFIAGDKFPENGQNIRMVNYAVV